MSVAIGELRRRLVIEAATDEPDLAGGVVRTFEPIGEVFAKITPRRRRESVDDGRQVGVVTHLITIRRRADVTGECRFVEGATVYRVLAVEDADPQRRFLDCWCEEEQR